MTLQHIRHYYEQPIVDWCATNGVELRADNMVEPNSDAADEFVVTNFNFGNFTEATLCGAIENVRGSLVVDFYSPKGVGPARAQTVMLGIMSELIGLTDRPVARDSNGVLGTLGPVTGPSFTALDDRPYFFATMSAPVLASVGDVGGGKKLTTRNVRLTNPKREADPTTAEVDLVTPVAGMKTQEDANKHFNERLENLEKHHDDNSGHDSGDY